MLVAASKILSAVAVTHSAGEPEWQCRAAAAAGNNFWQQPVHCQQAQIQDLNFSLEGLLSAHTENNPNRINSLHRPLPHLIMQGRLSPEERLRKKALAATGKFDNEAAESSFDGVIPYFRDASQSASGPIQTDSNFKVQTNINLKPYKTPISFLKEYAFREFGSIFNSCLQEKFSSQAMTKIGEQTLANSSAINPDYTGEELAQAAKEAQLEAGIRVTPTSYAPGAESLQPAPYGTVYIASKTYDGTRAGKPIPYESVLEDLTATYFHETANILAERATGNINAFGKNDPVDYDSGRQVELCMGMKLKKNKK